MSLRDTIARNFAGGPHFRIQPNRLLVEVDHNGGLNGIINSADELDTNILQDRPMSRERLNEVANQFEQLDFNVKRLENLGVLVAEADNLQNVITNIQNARDIFSNRSIQGVNSVLNKARKRGSRTSLGGFIGSNLNFGNNEDASLEAKLRNDLINLSLKNNLTKSLEEVQDVLNVEMIFTRNTFGPRNLNVNVDRLQNLLDQPGPAAEGDLPDLGDAIEKIGVSDVRQTTRGEGAVVAILDTSFCAQFLQSERVIDTFSGPDVGSAYSAPEEGHGTMTAYSAAGDMVTSNLDWDGVAPEAGLLLARVTDSEGSMSFVPEALDWLLGHVKSLDRPVVSNHSYGVPMCSARPMSLCDSTSTKLAKALNKRDDHQGFYAAGNEAIYCGHRLGGMTNGINGINSDPSSITVGALRFDLLDAQSYSSHGFGTCASVNNDPKPDVSCLLPSVVPYGCQLKDMSTGQGGSNGGTSEATPITCGVGALIASLTDNAKMDTLQNALESTATIPRRTQINIVRGQDARFGAGQIRVEEAIDSIQQAVS